MTNIRIERTRTDIQNGWVVIADTRRFGNDTIMFEGSYDECFGYLDQAFLDPSVESYMVVITGEAYYGVYFDHDWLIVHRNGFLEQDWSKFGL